MTRLLVSLGALAAVISIPFLLKPEAEHDPRLATSPTQILNIITPHSESIRREFTAAFRHYMRRREGIDIFIEWRVPGGTSEIEKILDTEYTFAFKHVWKNQLGRSWTPEVAAAFNDRRLTLPEDPVEDGPGESARRTFLDSEIGIGLDLFFGGGAYPFVVNSGKGYLVNSGIAERQARWFQPEVIPQVVGGEPFYDPEFRWLGTCLTTFGICLNHDAIARLNLQHEPVDWNLLGHAKLFKEVSIADPSTSGSVIKAFEMILQQQMRRALDAARPDESAEDALARGWTAGMRLIRRIGANARYYANFAAKIPADVAAGNAAAGMCIDYYGRTFHERVQNRAGDSRMQFVTPEGGSSLSVDPIAMLRGAPNRRLALKFIEFTLSLEGQQLWNYRAGTPGGPKRQALRRLPVRKDIYQPEYLRHFADPDERPFEKSHLFHYEAAWTGRAFGAIRFILKSMCVDAHAELQDAWQALIEHNFPPVATALFDDVARVSYAVALGEISEILKRSKLEQSRYARDLTAYFRSHYRRVVKLARSGTVRH